MVTIALLALLVLILFLLWLLMKPAEMPSDYGHATRVRVEPEFVFPQPGDKVQLVEPVGVAMYAGRFYVADSSSGRVLVFDRFGQYLYDFLVGNKNAQGEIEKGTPVGIAVSVGRIYVADVVSKKIFIYNAMGNLLSSLDPKWSGKSAIVRPSAVSIWSQQYFGGVKIYLTDVGAHRFDVMDMSGQIEMVVGSKGKGDAEFLFPNGIAADANQKIFVSDSNNGKIQVFNSLGKFQFYFPLKKALPPFPKQNLILPRGIAIDDHGSVHVADAFLQKVFVFNGDGKFIGKYGDMGSEPDKFNLPNGVAIEGDRVAVADKANHRISVWRYSY